MIDEKKLIEDYMNNYLVKNDGTWNDAMDRAVELAKTAPKVSEWIPVSERLPEEYESVLFSTHFGGVKFGYITSYREWKDEAEGYTHCDDEVTAWQPIPEPWKENTDG